MTAKLNYLKKLLKNMVKVNYNNEHKYSKYSKFLSGLLRHFPEKFGVEVDEFGWANLKEVLNVLKLRYSLSEEEVYKVLKKVLENDVKGRFEVKNGKIRARYGHTINVNTKWSESEEIPPILYHGTSRRNIKSILAKGLLPMKRKEVHLSESVEDAREVGLRYDSNPIILRIDAKKMIEDGYEIRKKGKVYTTDFVPAKYITDYLGQRP